MRSSVSCLCAKRICRKIAYPCLNIKIDCIFNHANDVTSHQAIEGIAVMLTILNMMVTMPADYWAAPKPSMPLMNIAARILTSVPFRLSTARTLNLPSGNLTSPPKEPTLQSVPTGFVCYGLDAATKLVEEGFWLKCSTYAQLNRLTWDYQKHNLFFFNTWIFYKNNFI